jgi:hypothetical protein
MEQYWMPKKLDSHNLRRCLNNYEADSIYIRLVGSMGGTVKVNESLKGKKLDFEKNSSGLHMMIDGKDVFHFPLKDYDKGFSLAYERFELVEGGERMVLLGTGIDPYDPSLPEPRQTVLRHCLDDHLMEIFFTGRIPIKFHSWLEKPDWKYWTIA